MKDEYRVRRRVLDLHFYRMQDKIRIRSSRIVAAKFAPLLGWENVDTPAEGGIVDPGVRRDSNSGRWIKWKIVYLDTTVTFERRTLKSLE